MVVDALICVKLSVGRFGPAALAEGADVHQRGRRLGWRGPVSIAIARGSLCKAKSYYYGGGFSGSLKGAFLNVC
jgi:hypothetical protein